MNESRGASALFVAGVVATLVLIALIGVLPDQPIADEVVHFAQAQAFASGRWQIHPELSTWPTTNLITAAALSLTGIDSIVVARATVAGFALLASIGFFFLATHFDRPSAALKSAQFFLLPVVLPYCGLAYSDIPALAAILWMFFGAVKQRFALFALAGILAVAFRQTNIVWLAAGIALYAHELPRIVGTRTTKRMAPVAILGACIAVVWCLIIWAQGGIAMTALTQSAHVAGLRGLPNVEFAIGLGGVLFCPVLVSTGSKVLRAIRSVRGAALFVGIVLVVGLGFVITHPYNIEPSLVDGFLRNRILFAITHTPMLWAFAFVVAAAVFAFGLVVFAPRAVALKLPLYTIGAASLLPFALVEQRYYLPLFALFWAVRAPVGRTAEGIQLVLNLCLSAAVLTAIAKWQVFL